jgi:hypothetical protein
MDTATQTLVSTIAAAVAAVAAVFALGIAVVALFVARSTLREARSTTEAQRETLRATQAAATATGVVAGRIETSTRVLRLIFAEAQATRELEQLRRVADQIALLIPLRRAVRKASLQPDPDHLAPWFAHNDAQALLAAHLEGLAPDELPKCRQMATADPRHTDGLDEQATHEIKEAITTARLRLEQLTAEATTELTRSQGGGA